MYVVYDIANDKLIYGPFETWEETIVFADHVLLAGVNTEIRLLVDPSARIMRKFQSTAND